MKYSKYLIELGSIIRAKRNKVGISQEKLAEESGLHRTYIGGVERGERNISFINLLRISKALNLKPKNLLENFPNYKDI